MLFAVVYCTVDARKWCQDPSVNVGHLIHMVDAESAGSDTNSADNISEKS